MRRFELDQYKSEIIRLYVEEKLSCKKISLKINASLCGIYDALRRWGISTRDLSLSHREYKVDENFFDIIDTEEKAYWLGFIYADGYISLPNHFGIALAKKDIGHLQKLLIHMKSDYPLKNYQSKSDYGKTEYTRFLVNNSNIFNQLKNKGVHLKKSLILDYPNEDILPKQLYRHFIRGYFDGDGSLILSVHSINFKICGTKEFLTVLINIFNEISDYKFQYKLFKRRNDDKNNYYISYGGKYKIYPIMNYLYENSKIYLDRKMEKYLILKNLYNN
ncbi:hypothetical protein [Candidatus Clostridium radicumherbarum]|uniref:DOD-type homing endonuclease domain-containing protein n=1 Tax=Candidatus Clostridium radicumherbarum TaxID=3381662 RepID=A0ABW8TTA6_9CLOT